MVHRIWHLHWQIVFNTSLRYHVRSRSKTLMMLFFFSFFLKKGYALSNYCLVKRTALDAIRQLTGSKNGPTFAGAYRWDPFDPQCSKCEFFPFDCSDAYNQASIFRPACGKHVSRPTALDTNTKRLEESQHPPVSPWNPDRQANSSEILQPQTVTSVTPHSHEKLPCEIFRLVAKYLSFSDITNLRLVDKSFERVVSTCLFHTVFIPFNTEIYGSLSMQEQQLLAQAQECDGATKPKTLPSVESERLGADSLRHRMRDLDMFGGFGSHVSFTKVM